MVVIASYTGTWLLIQYIGRNQSNSQSRRLVCIQIHLVISLSNLMNVDRPPS